MKATSLFNFTKGRTASFTKEKMDLPERQARAILGDFIFDAIKNSKHEKDGTEFVITSVNLQTKSVTISSKK